MREKDFYITRSRQAALLILLALSILLLTPGCSGNQLIPASTSITEITPSSVPEQTPTPTPTSTVQPSPRSTQATPTPSPSPSPTSELVTVEPTLLPQPDNSAFTLRGVWVHPKLFASPEKADRMLDTVQAANFNAIFVLVFIDGNVYFESNLVEKKTSNDAPPDYDPLGYVVTKAHQRGLQVHAWFTVGRIGPREGEPGPILSRHPEWGLVDAAGSSKIHWLNFTRPEARQFMSDLILGVARNYDVDGIHLDYIRYPGENWSFDAYSVETLAAEYDIDLESLRYPQLPAFGSFHGNPLILPWTAEVLAEFDDGTPAVTQNNYGQGKVIVLNWHAEDQQVAVSSEILRRSLEFLLNDSDEVYILRSETNEARYTNQFFKKNNTWLESLGWQPVQVSEQDLETLSTNSVLVMPNIYVMTAATAAALANFVENGGNLIFIDGPTKAMQYADVRAMVGMLSRGLYFKGERTISAVGQNQLIPAGGQVLDPETREQYRTRWNAFRAEGVTALVKDVYQRVKEIKPKVQISAAVFRRKAWADRKFQDWYSWLDKGYVDFVTPMAYVGLDETSDLADLIDEWQTLGDLDQIKPGLSVADFQERNNPLKTPYQLLQELELLKDRGIKGVLIFDLQHLMEDQVAALISGSSAP